MVDIFLPPRKEQVEKLRELLGDPFLWSLVITAIKRLDEKDYIKSCEVLWFVLTKQMFRNYPAIDIFSQVEQALYEVSDKQDEKKIVGRWLKSLKVRKREKIKIDGGNIIEKIVEKISIIDLAEKYGIKVKGKMALCPFHADKNPSLSLDDKRGLFRCFGCNVSGNIIKFNAMLKKLKNKNG